MVQDFKPSLDVTSLSPLRRFKGTLEKYTPMQQKAQDGRDYMQIEFPFKDLEVIDATEVYAFPIAQIRVGYSTNASTRWGALAKSIKTVCGPEATIDSIVGKHQEWAMLPYSMRQMNKDTQEWEDAKVDCWQLVSMDGVAPAEDLNPYIASVMDGKNEQQANQALMTDPKIIARPQLIEDLTARKLVDALLMAGLVTRDAEGIFHKV